MNISKKEVFEFLPYSSILNEKDFKKDRPFISYYTSELVSVIEETINNYPPDLEVATLAFEELNAFRKNKLALKKAYSIIKKSRNSLIEWLPEARNLIKDIPKCKEGKSTIYVILRGGYTTRHHYYGAYIGSSSKSPEKRFNEHKSGFNDARGMKKNAIQLLRSLYWKWSSISGDKKIKLLAESVLNEYLNKSIITLKVSGDVKYPIQDWGRKYLKLKDKLLRSKEYTK